jgi:hypothetical protein
MIAYNAAYMTKGLARADAIDRRHLRASMMRPASAVRERSADAGSKRLHNSLHDLRWAQHPLHTLQQTIGNQAVLRLLELKSEDRSAPSSGMLRWDRAYAAQDIRRSAVGMHIQRQGAGSGEIEMPAEDFNSLPASPALIKSRHGKTDWIRDITAGGSLNEKDWTENKKDVKKLCSDAAKVAQVESVFDGPAAVPNIADAINVVENTDSHTFMPGLNFSESIMEAAETTYVNAEGAIVHKLNPGRTEALPKIAVALGSKALSTKAQALTVLRHEMVHVEHLNTALKAAQRWQADTKTKSSFDDWLDEKGGLSDLDTQLVRGAANDKQAQSELLAYTEGFMTEFLLADPPKDNDDAAFLQLFGMFSSSSEPWANSNGLARSEALGRLQQYFCQALDGPHQEAFERFATAPPTKQSSKAPAWNWAPKRQMHQHFFDGLKRIVDAKCAGLGGRKAGAPPTGVTK